MKFQPILSAATLVISVSLVGNYSLANKGEKFADMDTDHDKAVTAHEFDTAMTSKFTAADKDGNGELTTAELSGFMMEEKGKSPDKAASKSERKVAMYDADGNGTLTQTEFMSGTKEKFTKMDADGNGSLSETEMKAAHAGKHKSH